GYRVLRVDSFEFGIFREGDRLVAYENNCPHDGGPVCQGKVIPRVEEELASDQRSRGLRFSKKKRNIVCPWHGWEFDIDTSRAGPRNSRWGGGVLGCRQTGFMPAPPRDGGQSGPPRRGLGGQRARPGRVGGAKPPPCLCPRSDDTQSDFPPPSRHDYFPSRAQ